MSSRTGSRTGRDAPREDEGGESSSIGHRLAFVSAATGLLLGYVAVWTVRHHRQADTWRERFFEVPTPVLWTPDARST